MRKIYIAGPMTGYPDYNRAAFMDAEHLIITLGAVALNPARIQPPETADKLTHDDYMVICKAMIDVCDTVYFLRGWEDSVGANIEKKYAEEKIKRIVYQDKENEL